MNESIVMYIQCSPVTLYTCIHTLGSIGRRSGATPFAFSCVPFSSLVYYYGLQKEGIDACII